MATFSFSFTPQKLNACIPNLTPDWFNQLNQILPASGIVTLQETAEFLAQTSYESGNFQHLEENLNYGAPGLVTTFPRCFGSLADALPYSRQPQKIANRVYANILGNGSESSGDGWNYRGRGLLQITGKYNYGKCSQDMFNNNSLTVNPELLAKPQGAIISAVWFWKTHNDIALTDRNELSAVTKTINPAMLGNTDRIANYNKFLKILGS